LLDQCLGKSQIYVDQYEKHPNEDSNKWKGDDTPQGRVADMGKTLSDPIGFYIGIVPDGLQTPNSVIEYRLTPSTKRASPFIPANRDINTAPFPGGITLSWSAAAPVHPNDILKYRVFYAEDTPNLVMSSECGLTRSAHPYGDPLDGDANKPTMSIKIDKDLKYISYLFNVLVYDQNGGFAIYKQVNSIHIFPPEDGPDGNSLPISWILGIGIPIFLITTVAIVYLFIRNRKLTKELEIEMHDVPKAVVRKAVRGPLEPEPAPNTEAMKQNKKSDKKYSRLLTDDDEEEDYAPPDFLSNEL